MITSLGNQLSRVTDTEAMEKEMAAIQKKYKALEKSKRHLEKSLSPLSPYNLSNFVVLLETKASKTNKYDSDGDDNYDDDGFESEEVDPPSGKGFFAQSVCIQPIHVTCLLTESLL